MKRKLWNGFLLVLIVCFVVVFGTAFRGDLGITEAGMEREIYEYLDEGRTVSHDVGERMAAWLEYDEEVTDGTLHVYVKRQGAWGWFFRYGGSVVALEDYVMELHVQDNPEYTLASMNAPKVCCVEIVMPEGTEIIELESEKPFVIVIPREAGNVTLYDIDGNIVEPMKQTT